MMKNDVFYVVWQLQGQEKSRNIKRIGSLAMELLNLIVREIVHLHIADFALWLGSNCIWSCCPCTIDLLQPTLKFSYVVRRTYIEYSTSFLGLMSVRQNCLTAVLPLL